MVKRKISTNGDSKTKKKSKNVADNNGNIISYKSPSEVMSSLLSPITTQDFFEKHWEKKFLHVKRGATEYYKDLFTLDDLRDLVKEVDLEFETDVNVCRYVNEEKEYLNDEGDLTVEKLDKLFKDKKATLQFHQPQRFNDVLWEIMGNMETYFSSLVGANVYITPPNSQGLAPHCDDVEIFVLQLEGTKTWTLYQPKVELSRDYTQDLPQDSIGEPIAEVLLEPGDLLYFPRGTIHQAKTGSEVHSTHISISTYQENSWGDFMQHLIQQAIENAMEDDVSFREGLPTDCLKYLGSAKDMGKYIEDGEENQSEKISNEKDKRVMKFKEKIKNLFSKLVDHIDVNTAADAMSADFMTSRLPPFGHEVKEDEESDKNAPTINDEIKLRFPEHVRLVYMDDDKEDDPDISQLEDDESEIEEDEKPAKTEKESPTKKTSAKRKSKLGTETEDDDEDEDANPAEQGPHLRIMHSLDNDRERHMIGMEMPGFVGTLKLPVHFATAANKLLNSKEFVKIKELALEDDEDKLTLATTLFADDLIEIKS